MVQRHNGWVFWGWTSTVMLGLWACALADVTFNTFSSQLIFKTSASQLLLGKAQNISGWSDLSIAKDFGRNTPASWVEGFASGAIISQSGGTAVPQIHLIVANSNAVTWTGAYPTPPAVTQNSVDGTTYVQYEPNHHIFHNNGNAWTVRGWVRFNNGFTVMDKASVLMDTLTTVSGGMDLRDTGTLILNNDMYLSHNVTLTNGGNIKGKSSTTQGGQANTIFMGGDLTLASTTFARTLHIIGDWSNSGTSGDLIIDGCGHTFNIGDRAQIFVDTNITLTLRNMTIKTGPKSLNNPAIQLASLGSKLVLDNVMFDLGADFHFITGQIFVHDEVAVTGTSAFVYQSPMPSYITSGATLSFEQATTFSVAPSTFTDCPFTVNNTYTNNAFLVLADASSALSLNGCSFQTTFTGLRLRSGMLLFDNKVAIDTTAGVDLASTATTPIGYLGRITTSGVNPNGIAWSPDGRFLAVSYITAPYGVQVYRFNSGGINGSTLLTPVGGVAATDLVANCVSWSPDGRFFIVSNASGPNVQAYRFNGFSTPTPVGLPVKTGSPSNPDCVSFSPDGRYFAVAAITAGTLQTYRFDGISTPVRIGSVVTSLSQPQWLAWSPDGRFLAVACLSGSGFQVYRFLANGAPAPVGVAVSTPAQVSSIAWSPDGRFLAVAQNSGVGAYIYRFNGQSTPAVVTNAAINVATNAITWSPDGRFIAFTQTTNKRLHVYRFDQMGQLVSLGFAFCDYPLGMAWSPDGNFIAVVNLATPGVLRIFHCNFYYTGQPSATQGFSNGLVFGDKLRGTRQGTSFDANVQLMGGAAVTVNGMVSDDSA